MLGEAWHLSFGSNVLSQQIGHGTLWAVAFAFGAVCVALTTVLSPSPCRAVLAAFPVAVQLTRSFETWSQLDLPVTSGGVTVRVALAAMMAGSLGWSADVKHRAAAVRANVDDLA